MDIDSGNFDPKRYVLSMIKQNTIKQLIRKNNQIDEQIKVHDHQIQSLVFENYSKFISSIDTVRQMKDNICMVDDKLKVLESSMNKIQELALKIDSTFSVKRKEIQKLDTINKDLQKLKNLCDFPNVLKQDITYYKSLQQSKIPLEIQKLFTKSVAAYESCYKTLCQLREEPLISPIYKESLDKVQNIRSILKALQVQFKGKVYSSALRNITKKLLIITDDQVSILRIYFHSWKQRLGETCFKGPRKISSQLSAPQNNKYLMNEVVNAEIPQINEELWKQFIQQFRFIYKDVYPKLSISHQQIQLHINNHMKEIFLWGLNNYIDAAPMYCASLKAYVHVTHIITNKITESLDYMRQASGKQDNKMYIDLKQKMQQRLQNLGVSMFNYIFGKVKIYFILQIIKKKIECQLIPINEQAIKQSQIKILNPLKQNLTTNFRILIDELEHFRNIYEFVFKNKSRYEQVIHKKIQELIMFLSQIVSLPSTFLSENVNTLINPNFGNKLNKIQKGIIQKVSKQLRQTNESGAWFFVAHHFLAHLNNVLGKRIIESVQKNVQIPKNHDYGKVFNSSKICISKNLLSFANYYANLTTHSYKFSQMLQNIQSFMILINSIFYQNKRNIIKKPSFLTQQNSFAHQTQILTAKKLHLIQKKNPQQRNSILTYFIRKVIKQILINIRRQYSYSQNLLYGESDIYNLIQICYELSNVEEESQICAFYHFIKSNWNREWKLTRQQMEEKYLEVRKDFVC